MTDKLSFLDKLNAALVERGISDGDIAPYLERFDRFYDRMVSDTAATSRALENVEGIADNIASQISDRYDEMNRLAERTLTMSVVSDATEQFRKPIVQEDDLFSQASKEDVDTEFYEPGIVDQPTAEADIVEISEKVKPTEEEQSEFHYSLQLPISEPTLSEHHAPIVTDIEEGGSVVPQRLPDYVEEEPLGNTKTFYAIFFATLPVTAALGVVGLSTFVGMWVILGAAIGALIACLVGVATAGAAVSLIGMVYGIIRLFDNVSVGLYEIGLGVLTAGASLLVGILIYNIAIRLLPFVIKQVYRLFIFVLKKLKGLFIHMRKECSKL